MISKRILFLTATGVYLTGALAVVILGRITGIGKRRPL